MDSSIEYKKIVDLVADRMGLAFNDHREKLLQDALKRMLSSDLTLAKILTTLLCEPETHPLWRTIIQVLTVGETYFFRNQAHLKALRENVLPELIERRRKMGTRLLRIWSAGCATGEEPYSLAMMLHDLLSDIDLWSIDLIGTDINEEFLGRARAGFYRSHSFRGETPQWLQARWFQAKDGGFEIAPEIRRMVRFMPLNLIRDEYPIANTVDIVLCRNVTIYFDRKQTQYVMNRMYDVLGVDGWLIIGHSEPQPEIYDAFISRNFENAIFYQKPPQKQCVTPVAQVGFAPRPAAPIVFASNTQTIPTRVPAAVVEAVPEPVHMGMLEQALAAANNEQWGEAFRLLEQAERDDVLLPQLHYLRGLIHMQTNDLPSAIEALRQALYCDPSFALAHYTLGELYEKTGTMVEAQRHWHRARKVLTHFDPQEILPFGNDLTVEMLNGLLDYRLRKLS